ncbi:MAG: class I SAM-dependent methyltransferase [candidate division WOR-3 bacterium]|nr:class I SAM-dependent methyltransferase [candidate division WOR-3 bacterium]
MPEYDAYSVCYDLLWANKQDDVPFYLAMAKETRGPVLELACGTGRVLLPLARAEFEVTGLDVSQAMLDKLQAKLDQEPREVQGRVALKCADMRDYRFSQKFKLVFCAFNSFLHLMTTDDQLACLRSVREYLADDGRLVLNVFAPDHNRLTGRADTEVAVERDPETGRDMVVTDISKRDLTNQTIEVWEGVDRIGDDGTVKRYSATFTLSWIHNREMHLLLRLAGFEVVAVYGGYDKRPYDYASGIQLFVAKKV